MQSAGQHQDHQALLEAYLRALNLPMFLQLYQSYAQDAARSGLSFERFLLALCEAEIADREARRIESAIRRAKFPFLKELTDFLDRLTHKGRIIEFVGESYRYRHRLQRGEAEGA